jgi:hypothetical protein
MTFSPDVPPASGEVEPYDVPRGTCPRCGSRAVRHLVIGFPAHPEALDSLPAWVEFVGCLHPGHDRECRRCGLEYLDDSPM